MRVLTKVHIGIRTQAIAVIAVVAIWSWSLWLGLHAGKGFISNMSLLWNIVFIFFPFLAPYLHSSIADFIFWFL